MQIETQYSLIPPALIHPPTTYKDFPEEEFDMEFQNPFSNFSPSGETAGFSLRDKEDLYRFAGESFSILPGPLGTLFVSRRNYTEGMNGELVPRSLLITQAGAQLIKSSPGILKKINKHSYPMRPPLDKPDEGVEGKVHIMTTENGKTYAVKEFKRFKDGRRHNVGGIEQAEAYYYLDKKNLKDKRGLRSSPPVDARSPKVYFASQDVLVMENVEMFPDIRTFVTDNPTLQDQVVVDLVGIYSRMRIKEIKGMISRVVDDVTQGVLDRLFSPARIDWSETHYDHVFVEGFNEKTGQLKYILIDPNF